MIEWIIVFLIVAASVAYAVYRIVQLYRGKSDPCSGCSEVCSLRGLKSQKKKKDCEKFG